MWCFLKPREYHLQILSDIEIIFTTDFKANISISKDVLNKHLD